MLRAQNVLFAFSLILWMEYKICLSERVTYFSLERPTIYYSDTKYLSFVNVSSRRPGRSSLIHYIDINFTVLIVVDNSIQFDFYFFEYLSNTYRRSFVEMHFRTCDLVLKDKFFGTGVRKTIQKCPFPPGTYAVTNFSIPFEQVPEGFPFRKGRIYVNVTLTTTKELITAGHIDMELKEFSRKKQTGGKLRK